MLESLPIAIGVGLVASLLLSEALGIASAGMVVPGYVALFMKSPLHLCMTFGAALVTYAGIRLAGRFVILYGRRRTALSILLGYLVGGLSGVVLQRAFPQLHLQGMDGLADPVVGYIIPGLIAIWMDRQGVVETVGALTICSVIVRLCLILLLGSDLPELGVVL